MMYCMSHQVTCSLYLYGGACLTRRPQRWDSISHAQQSSQAGWPWSQPPPRPGCICPRTPCRTAWSWGREQTVEAHAKPDIRFSAQLNDLPGSNWWLNVVARWGFELGRGPDDLGCTFLSVWHLGWKPLDFIMCPIHNFTWLESGLRSRIRRVVWCRISTVHLTGRWVCMWLCVFVFMFLCCSYLMQWAAVMTQLAAIRDPPQVCLHTPSLSYCREICRQRRTT